MRDGHCERFVSPDVVVVVGGEIVDVGGVVPVVSVLTGGGSGGAVSLRNTPPVSVESGGVCVPVSIGAGGGGV